MPGSTGFPGNRLSTSLEIGCDHGSVILPARSVTFRRHPARDQVRRGRAPSRYVTTATFVISTGRCAPGRLASGFVAERVEPRAAVVAMLVLTMLTGLVDAVSYLVLDTVFTANMTGNLVLLGLGLGGYQGGSTAGSVVAMAGFLCGALIGGTVAYRLRAGETGYRRLLVLGLGIETLLLAAATLITVLGDLDQLTTRLAVTAVLAVAMGSQSAVARLSGVADLVTTVVTSMMVGLAAASARGGPAGGRGDARRAAGAGARGLAVAAGDHAVPGAHARRHPTAPLTKAPSLGSHQAPGGPKITCWHACGRTWSRPARGDRRGGWA